MRQFLKIVMVATLSVPVAGRLQAQASVPVVVIHGTPVTPNYAPYGTWGMSGQEPPEPREKPEKKPVAQPEIEHKKGKLKVECVTRPFPACRFEAEGEKTTVRKNTVVE